jgi:hypothetical protein
MCLQGQHKISTRKRYFTVASSLSPTVQDLRTISTGRKNSLSMLSEGSHKNAICRCAGFRSAFHQAYRGLHCQAVYITQQQTEYHREYATQNICARFASTFASQKDAEKHQRRAARKTTYRCPRPEVLCRGYPPKYFRYSTIPAVYDAATISIVLCWEVPVLCSGQRRFDAITLPWHVGRHAYFRLESYRSSAIARFHISLPYPLRLMAYTEPQAQAGAHAPQGASVVPQSQSYRQLSSQTRISRLSFRTMTSKVLAMH